MSSFRQCFVFCIYIFVRKSQWQKYIYCFEGGTNAPQKQPGATENGGTGLLPVRLFAPPSGTSCILTLIYILSYTSIFGAAKKRISLCIPDPPLVSFLLSYGSQWDITWQILRKELRKIHPADHRSRLHTYRLTHKENGPNMMLRINAKQLC